MSQTQISLSLAGNRFVFSSEGNFAHIPNITRFKTKDGGALWGFDALYPQAMVTIEHLKAIAPVQATGTAVPVAKKLVGVRDALMSNALLDDNADLFKYSPYAHQASAITAMLHYDRLALLFEQGLGKTYIALLYLALKQRLDGTRTRMLAVAPKIVAPNWLREAAKYTELKGVLLLGSQSERDAAKRVLETDDWDFIITTYDVLGTSQSNKKKLRSTKEAKIDYWLDLKKRDRRMLTDSYKRRKLLLDEEATMLVEHQGGAKKQRAELWNVLKLVAKSLNTADVSKYQLEYSDLEFLKARPYDVVVFDEASRIKNHRSARTEAAMQLAEKAKSRYHLSGTLCNGSPIDMYAPFTLLNSKLWGSFENFSKRYVRYSPDNKHIIVGYNHLGDLKVRIDPYKSEAKRSDCLDQPPRLIQRVDVDLDPDLVGLYSAIAHSEISITVNDYIINTRSPVVKLQKLAQVMSGFLYPTMTMEHYEWCNTCPGLLTCLEKEVMPWHDKCTRREEHGLLKAPRLEPILLGSAKLNALKDDLEDSVEKTIIWCEYQADKARIASLLQSLKIKYITAETKNCDALFEADSECRVFLGQISQGIGITLNSATRTIYYSHGMALEPREQSMDRNYRIGQKEKVLVRDYVDSYSLERNILDLLDHKIDVKAFLQSRVECLGCFQSTKCIAENIPVYSDKCLFKGTKDNAERKSTISVLGYGNKRRTEDDAAASVDTPFYFNSPAM